MESLTYAYRKSALEKEKSYELTKEGLTVTEEGKSPSSYAYSDIAEVNLTYAPTKYATVYQCTTRCKNGQGIVIKSHHFAGIADFEDRSLEYAGFIRRMHKLLTLMAPHASYRKGIKRITYLLSLGVFAIAGVVFPIVALASLFVGNYLVGGIGIIACIFLFMKMRAYAKKNKPGTYLPSELPENLLPYVGLEGDTTSKDAKVELSQ